MRRAIIVLASMLLWVAGAAAANAQSSDTSRVHLGPPEGGADAFVAWPSGKAAAPGIVVVQEWWGLNAQIRDVARRLAKEGYVAIVPDLYHGKVTTDPEQAHVLLRGLESDVALRDLGNAVTWLRAEPRVGKKRIGVVGFCMGGGLAQALALNNSEISAVVMFYGLTATDAKSLAALHGPLQGHFGELDDGIPIAKVEELRAGLKQAGKSGEVYLYSGAGHAFMNDTRPSYHPDAARQGWARMLAFFQKNLRRS
jgi:carboxymethylenebutenolidase